MNEEKSTQIQITTTDAVATPVKKKISFSLIEVVVFVFVAAVMVYVFSKHFEQPAESGMPSEVKAVSNSGNGGVYIVDFSRLLRSEIKVTLDSDRSVKEAGTEFAKKFNKTMDEYRSNGSIVLNSSATLEYPSSNDITQLVADRMGIKLGQ